MKILTIRTLSFCLLGTLSMSFLPLLITRHDIEQKKYLKNQAEYPSVVQLKLLDATGVVVNEGIFIERNWIITTAHGLSPVVENSDLNILGTSYKISKIILHPDWDGELNDNALIQLDRNADIANPIQLYKQRDEIGKNIILAGHGWSGTGLEGPVTNDEKLRVGTNKIDSKISKSENQKKVKVVMSDCPNEVEIFGDVRFQGDVFRGSFAPDGNTFYFFRKIVPNTEEYRIYFSTKEEGKWSDPQILNLGGEYSDIYPSLSKDGKRIVFSSYRPVPEQYQSGTSKNANLWYAVKGYDGWGTPVFMANVNEVGYYHSWVEFGWDDNIYFRKTTPDWTSNQTLYTQWDGKHYSVPIVFEEVEQWKNWSKDIRIVGGSPGPSKNLIFLDVATYNPETNKRGSDIWVSIKRNQKWEEPVTLGKEVNQDGYDVFPFFSPDAECFYFIKEFDKFYNISLNTLLH